MLNFYYLRQDYLKFEGSDRLDLINRLSTNQVNTLQQFKGIKSVLTNDKGRFIDLITLYDFGDFVFTTCSFNNAVKVLSHLEKYTIMDDFKTVNMAGTHESILIFGDDAGKYAEELFNIDINKFSENDFKIYIEDDKHSIIAGNDDSFKGYMFIYEADDHEFWLNKLLNYELRAKYEIKEIDDREYETKRIDYGIPAYGKEMSEFTNPLECGLNHYVSFTKGCYIGQEVISRLDTHDKISKHLVKIAADKEFTADNAKILADGKECGFVTSVINNIGLGFVKTIFLDFNKTYFIKQNDLLINCKLKPINNINN